MTGTQGVPYTTVASLLQLPFGACMMGLIDTDDDCKCKKEDLETAAFCQKCKKLKSIAFSSYHTPEISNQSGLLATCSSTMPWHAPQHDGKSRRVVVLSASLLVTFVSLLATPPMRCAASFDIESRGNQEFDDGGTMRGRRLLMASEGEHS